MRAKTLEVRPMMSRVDGYVRCDVLIPQARLSDYADLRHAPECVAHDDGAYRYAICIAPKSGSLFLASLAAWESGRGMVSAYDPNEAEIDAELRAVLEETADAR